MNALKVAFNAAVQQVAQWMQAAGYTAEQIARALNDAGVDPVTVVRILKALGYPVLLVAVILMTLPAFVLMLGATVIPPIAACAEEIGSSPGPPRPSPFPPKNKGR